MESTEIKIFSPVDSPRLRYIAGILLGDILGLSWTINSDKRKLGKHPVINYSAGDIAGSFKINPGTILFEKGIFPKNISVTDWKGLPVFFQTYGSDLPFDIFAASFFLITRYEEYLETERDKYGRYKSSSSLAFKNGFLNRPIIDLWAREMAKNFLKKFPSLVFRRNEYKSLLTIDTDQPFAYLGKNIFKSIGGIFREKKGIHASLGDQYRIMTKEEKDPFDVFDWVIEKIENNGLDTRFFFPVGDHSEYDHNPSWRNEEYRNLITRIADRYQTGLHPTFVAGGKGSLVNTEVSRLRSILGKEIKISRFHYIRIFMPDSYKSLIKAGISEDYSMGYPDETGFRAGIARPFYFYDLTDDIQTTLEIFPFQVMDGTLYDYKKLDPESSKDVILQLINETRRVGGLFASIWHNTSILDTDDCKRWREVFEFMIKYQKP